jgi:TonB family protein
MRITIPLMTLGLLLWPVAPASANQVSELDRLVEEIYETLEVRAMDCVEDRLYAPLYVSYCGKSPKRLRDNPDKVTLSIEKLAAEAGALRVRDNQDTDKQKPKWPIEIIYRIDDSVLNISYHRSGRLDMFYVIDLPDCLQVCRNADYMSEEYLTMPELLVKGKPEYPGRARHDGVEGAVLLQTVVDEEGIPGEMCAAYVTNPEYGFDKQAGKAVKKWRYTPALKEGEPISFCLEVIVTFHLR